MHTYPEVLFRVNSYTMQGHSCLPDKPPLDRQLDFNAASNLFSDAEQVRFHANFPCEKSGQVI